MAVFFMMLAFAGCAATEQARRPGGPSRPSARPVHNLTGYSPAFKDGYIDGCETAKKTAFGLKNKLRFADDAQYRLGWNDGSTLCRR